MTKELVIVRYRLSTFVVVASLSLAFAAIGLYSLNGQIDWGWRREGAILCSLILAILLAGLFVSMIRIRGALVVGHDWGIEVRRPSLVRSKFVNLRSSEMIQWSMTSVNIESQIGKVGKIKTLQLRSHSETINVPISGLVVNRDCLERLSSWKATLIDASQPSLPCPAGPNES